MLPTPDFISTFIEQQFPAFYREEGPHFIAFVKAYYEWLEETGNNSHKTRNLFSTRDIDLTADQFVEEFKKKYLQGIPKEIAGDKRFLQKHILDLYRSKGSLDGLKLLFRLLYNEEIQVYIPSYDMLKPSHGKWVEKQYIEVSFTPYNYNFNNKLITGVTSGATAFVESFERTFIDNRIINLFYISNIQGIFVVDEKIIYDGLSAIDAPKILGSPNSVTINSTVPNNTVGDILIPSSGNGSGTGLKTIVSTVVNAGTSNATIEFKVINGGAGYTTNPTISITAGSNSTGAGATFTGIVLKNTSNFTYSPSLINYAPYYPVTETFNANTKVDNAGDFITIANNVFANNDRILYTTSAGNTTLTGLTNNTSYWVVSANSSGLKLSTTRGGANINITASTTSESGHNLYKNAVVRFNANGDVANTTDFISIPNNLFANGDHVTYLVEAGNTAISGLTNNTIYYVVSANTTGLKLATSYAGANINITAGVTEYGHTLAAINVASYPLNSGSYGPSLNNASLSSIINTAIVYVTTTIGTIDKLTGINPGSGYDGYLSVSVIDPITSRYGIPDATGGIQGADAVINANVVIGTGLASTVRILNSGLGYYTKAEDVQLYNMTQSNTSQISTATITLGGVGTQEGFWADTRGFLDSNKYIQDSYYYQEYSYEVKSSKALNKYKKILKDVFHPVGNELFGRSLLLAVDDTQQGTISNPQTIYRILGSELAASDTFNANTGVANTTEYITTIGINDLADNDYVQYYTEANNTPIGGLANNSKYFVINSNTSTLQLSTSQGGAAINITSKNTETGHHLVQSVPASGNAVFLFNISRLT
jgi:hypothetical protein